MVDVIAAVIADIVSEAVQGAFAVAVAIVTGLFAIKVALMGKDLKHVRETVGTKNGNGDLAQMNARLLAWHAESDARMQRVEDRLIELDNYSHDTVRGMNAALTALDRKIERRAA